MLDKIRAIWEYIKNNNVWSELKDRFTNVLQGYKSKLAGAANAWANALWSYGSQALASSPLHKTAVSAITKFKEAYAAPKKYNPYVRPAWERPVSDWDGIQTELDRSYKKDPSQYHDDSQQARDMEKRMNDSKEYNIKALNQF
jgi:hypothetical protein